MFQAALRPQALKCSVARTLQASEEARVTAAAKLFPGIKRLSERVLVQGLGSRVWDADGNELIDFASGIGVRVCSMAWRLTEVSLATQVRMQGARATSTLNTLVYRAIALLFSIS